MSNSEKVAALIKEIGVQAILEGMIDFTRALEKETPDGYIAELTDNLNETLFRYACRYGAQNV